MKPRVCFVIPTYNEAENITLLLGRLTDLYPDPNTRFLVVDDESPDGTGGLVRQVAGGELRVHLLEGKKRGLGAAYVRGITHVMDTLGAEIVVQMDADFSHDPDNACRLLARVTTDADVAIGSRYVDGGAVDETWGFRRRQISLWGNRMARWIAGLKGVRDCTAGFKAIRAAALRDARVERSACSATPSRWRCCTGCCTAARAWWRNRSTSATASAASPSSASTACWSSCTTSGGCASPATAPSSSSASPDSAVVPRQPRRRSNC